MNVSLADLNIKRLPPEETRIIELLVEPHPDGRKFRVGFSLTPFQKSPQLEIILRDLIGQVCTLASVIEPAGSKFECVLHIRALSPSIPYMLEVVLSYPELGVVDLRRVTLDMLPCKQE